MNDFPEYDNLPDDPEVAFVRLYEQLHGDFEERVQSNDKDLRGYYAEFMNSIIGVAQGLDIDGFGEWSVPDEWDDIYPAFTGFDRAVKRYVMEVKIRKSRVTKVYSVHLTDEEKEKIHSYINKIREVVSSADLEERKRNSLYAKLSAFEADVDRSRTRFDNAMLMTLDVISIVDQGVKTLNPLNELLRRIQDVMSKAKSKEPEHNQLPAPPDRKKLDPPPKKLEGPSENTGDEIPF